MKQPSDMSMPRFEHNGSDLWSNTLPLDRGRALNIKDNQPPCHTYLSTGILQNPVIC